MENSSLNLFGGDWTQQKIDIIYNYAKGYLTVFKNQPYTKLLYFDGFAGCGEIIADDSQASIEGAALKILSIDSPRSFDMYYFVELKKKLAKKLKELIDEKYPQKETYVVAEDCNNKLVSLAKFLKTEKGKKYKVLAFIDPKGMQVNWKSLEVLKNLPIDLWILTPTGVGTNRLLKKDCNISDSWLKKLEDFLGMPSREILEKFYSLSPQISLFGESEVIKERNAIEKIHQVYKSRLTTIFTNVSDAFVLRNSSNSIMYHFFMATNNDIALKIANSVVKPKYQ